MTRETPPILLADRRIPKGGGYLSAEELASLTPAELLRRVKALQPLIAENAAESERLRRPVDAVWEALRGTGFFYQFVPKRFGGMETDFQSFIDVGVAVAEADASLSWVATFCAEHNWILSHFPLETQEKLWGGDFPYIIAPYASSPPAVASPIDGGYRLKGRWKWGTGVMHADWVMGAAFIMGEAGAPPTPLSVLIPAGQAIVADTWRVAGMLGTGSNDIILDDVFVPDEHVVLNMNRSGRVEGERPHANPIYGVPLFPFLAMSAAIPALGATKAMLKSHVERLAQHVRMGSATTQSEKPAVHLRLGRADQMVQAAESIIRGVGHQLLEIAALREPEQTPARISARGRLAYAVSLCRDAAMTLAEGAGSGAHMFDNPFQRNLRDLLVISSHVVFDLDLANELHGRALIGLGPNSMLN